MDCQMWIVSENGFGGALTETGLPNVAIRPHCPCNAEPLPIKRGSAAYPSSKMGLEQKLGVVNQIWEKFEINLPALKSTNVSSCVLAHFSDQLAQAMLDFVGRLMSRAMAENMACILQRSLVFLERFQRNHPSNQSLEVVGIALQNPCGILHDCMEIG